MVNVSTKQLYLLRSQIYAIYDDKSIYRQKIGLLGRVDLEKEDIQVLESFYKESFYYPYLLNFISTLHSVSDVSDLWYREFHLELTKCVQFPIEMSLPWIMTAHIIGEWWGEWCVVECLYYVFCLCFHCFYMLFFLVFMCVVYY